MAYGRKASSCHPLKLYRHGWLTYSSKRFGFSKWLHGLANRSTFFDSLFLFFVVVFCSLFVCLFVCLFVLFLFLFCFVLFRFSSVSELFTILPLNPEQSRWALNLLYLTKVFWVTRLPKGAVSVGLLFPLIPKNLPVAQWLFNDIRVKKNEFYEFSSKIGWFFKFSPKIRGTSVRFWCVCLVLFLLIMKKMTIIAYTESLKCIAPIFLDYK